MEDSLVSIIMPTYNCAEYLERSINSVLNQSYKNLELIVVDDGSTDNSQELLQEFSKKDDRVKVFHKTNGGVHTARNYGLDKASGDFVMFIDADDEYYLDAVECFVANQKKYNADLVCGRVEVFVNGVHKSNFEEGETVLVGSAKDAVFIYSCYVNSVMTACCSKLYKKSVVDKVRQHKDLLFYEENFVMKCLSNVETMVVLPNFCYKYHFLDREDCLTQVAKKDLLNICINNMSELLLQAKTNFPNSPILWGKACSSYFHGLIPAFRSIINKYGDNQQQIKKEFVEILNNPVCQEVASYFVPVSSRDIFIKHIFTNKSADLLYKEISRFIND